VQVFREDLIYMESLRKQGFLLWILPFGRTPDFLDISFKLGKEKEEAG